MTSETEFALMSASAYRLTRDPNNQIPWLESLGWMPLKDADLPGIGTRLESIGFAGAAWHVKSSSGFEAVAYQKGGEVVIALSDTSLQIGPLAEESWRSGGASSRVAAR